MPRQATSWTPGSALCPRPATCLDLKHRPSPGCWAAVWGTGAEGMVADTFRVVALQCWQSPGQRVLVSPARLRKGETKTQRLGSVAQGDTATVDTGSGPLHILASKSGSDRDGGSWETGVLLKRKLGAGRRRRDPENELCLRVRVRERGSCMTRRSIFKDESSPAGVGSCTQ